MRNAWIDGESELVDETQFTPWAEPGWRSWNAYSPELKWCKAAANLTSYVGGVVYETGAGQGYVTRRVAERAWAHHVWESDDRMRKSIPTDSYFHLEEDPTFAPDDLKFASLLILDSGIDYRLGEIRMWHEYGDPYSYCFIHDAGNGHEGKGMGYTHNQHLALIRELGLTGIHYKNPRGSFLAWKNPPNDEEMEFFLRLLP